MSGRFRFSELDRIIIKNIHFILHLFQLIQKVTTKCNLIFFSKPQSLTIDTTEFVFFMYTSPTDPLFSYTSIEGLSSRTKLSAMVIFKARLDARELNRHTPKF